MIRTDVRKYSEWLVLETSSEDLRKRLVAWVASSVEEMTGEGHHPVKFMAAEGFRDYEERQSVLTSPSKMKAHRNRFAGCDYFRLYFVKHPGPMNFLEVGINLQRYTEGLEHFVTIDSTTQHNSQKEEMIAKLEEIVRDLFATQRAAKRYDV